MEKEPNLIKLGAMSECTAGGDIEAQKKCRFRKKSSHSDKCMHCVLDDENCDSLKAQMDAQQNEAEAALKTGTSSTDLPKQETSEKTTAPQKEEVLSQMSQFYAT
ncbi:hypothetical protein ACFLY5_01270 [Patescibacteria group bacterium]